MHFSLGVQTTSYGLTRKGLKLRCSRCAIQLRTQQDGGFRHLARPARAAVAVDNKSSRFSFVLPVFVSTVNNITSLVA